MQMPMSIGLAIPVTDASERELVEKAKRDREAFALLYRRHHALIAAYIYRRVGDSHVTEDLVADVFLSALRCLPKYRDRGLPIRAWLYRIAANCVNRWVRREHRGICRRLSELCERRQIDSDLMSEPANDGEYARLALLSLKPKYQTVLSLHYLEGLSLEEVASAVGCRLGTVKSRLSRGREALRVKLARPR